jgi:hypothetical protein
VVGWSRLAAALFADFGKMPEPGRLYLRLLITVPAMRRLYADWEEVTRLAIAQLRMESARYRDDPRLTALVTVRQRPVGHLSCVLSWVFFRP